MENIKKFLSKKKLYLLFLIIFFVAAVLVVWALGLVSVSELKIRSYNSIDNTEFKSLPLDDIKSVIEERSIVKNNVIFAEFLGVQNNNILLKLKGEKMKIDSAEFYFSYVCTSQEIVGDDYTYDVSKVKNVYFIETEELNDILSLSDPVIILIGRDELAATTVASYVCPDR